jgi:hypothetical protein
MRTVNNRAEGPQPEAGVYRSIVVRRSRRRKQAVIGAVGLVAVLSAGAVAVQWVGDRDGTATAADPGSVVPSTATTSMASTGSAPSRKPSAPASTGAPSAPAAADEPRQRTAAEQVAAARAAGAKLGTAVRRPLPSRAGGATAADDRVSIATSGTAKKNMRVVSARQDLSGQRELAWVAGEGERVGNALCAQRFRFSADMPAATRPTLLVCWRTSAAKSVYTVAVDFGGRPSRLASVAAIDSTWAKLA